MKRLASFAAAILLVACSGIAWAQDARTSEAQAVARDWVALVDNTDYQASWAAAGQKFKANIAAERWARAAKRVRSPLGALIQRTTARTTFTHHFRGAPDGDYALVLFRTSFANKPEAQETVTLEHESDGKWRVIGYTIR